MHDGLLGWFHVFVTPESECNEKGKKRKKGTHELKTRAGIPGFKE